MKKMKTMRAAALLLALTLITSCFVGGTFAKYVTSDNASDNARVAYWGFGDIITETDINMFDGDYTDVKSSDSTNVVAPGTAKTATLNLKYNVNGNTKAPEVAYKYDVVAEATSTNNYAALDANKNFKWTLKVPGAKAEDAATEYDTVAALVAAINATSQTSIAANTLPTGYSEAGAATYEIGWKWVFEGNETYEEGAKTQDQYDTAMGNDTTPDDVTITITITATQLDTTPIA